MDELRHQGGVLIRRSVRRSPLIAARRGRPRSDAAVRRSAVRTARRRGTGRSQPSSRRARPIRCRRIPTTRRSGSTARDASKSLVLGTMKVAAPDGALAVFGLDGKLRQLLKGPDRPNNVDVEYGLDLDATPTDIAVLTERLGRRLARLRDRARWQRRARHLVGHDADSRWRPRRPGRADGHRPVPPAEGRRDLRHRLAEGRARRRTISGNTASTTTGPAA